MSTPTTPQPPTPPPAPSLLAARIVAFIEVLICSDYPTQLLIAATFAWLGHGAYDASGNLSSSYVVGISLIDAVVLVALIVMFIHAHGERPRDIFLGRANVLREAIVGVPLIVVALSIAVSVLLTIMRFAPWLHTVARNPLQDLLRSPRDAWLFALVVIVAGGVREEIQRAFLLRRFEQWLGGGGIGVAVTSIAFGAGHLLQGVDAAIATGLLGAFWGVVYLRRRSSVAPIVSHAGFDLMQIVQFMLFRSAL